MAQGQSGQYAVSEVKLVEGRQGQDDAEHSGPNLGPWCEAKNDEKSLK